MLMADITIDTFFASAPLVAMQLAAIATPLRWLKRYAATPFSMPYAITFYYAARCHVIAAPGLPLHHYAAHRHRRRHMPPRAITFCRRHLRAATRLRY